MRRMQEFNIDELRVRQFLVDEFYFSAETTSGEVSNLDRFIDTLSEQEFVRLLGLVVGDHAPLEEYLCFDSLWVNFTTHLDVWKDESSASVLYNYFEGRANMKAMRFQTTYICSPHSVLLWLHLEKCVRDVDPNADIRMPDLSRMVMKLFVRLDDNDEQKQGMATKYVKNKVVMSAVNFLRCVYGIERNHMESFHPILSTTDLLAELAHTQQVQLQKKLGKSPAIVVFNLRSDFKSSTLSHDNKPNAVGKNESKHAMVAVGVRFDSSTKQIFVLCVNFWKHKPFVEMSYKYLSYCEAELHFLLPSTPIAENPKYSVPLSPGLCVETSGWGDEEDEEENEDDYLVLGGGGDEDEDEDEFC